MCAVQINTVCYSQAVGVHASPGNDAGIVQLHPFTPWFAPAQPHALDALFPHAWPLPAPFGSVQLLSAFNEHSFTVVPLPAHTVHDPVHGFVGPGTPGGRLHPVTLPDESLKGDPFGHPSYSLHSCPAITVADRFS
jgi:hypothetical protein